MKKLPLLSMFLLALSIIITITSCEKDEIDKLPSETMSGRNTFGCLVNGEAFIPRKTYIKHYLDAIFFKDRNYIGIGASNLGEFSFNLVIFKPNVGMNFGLCCDEDLYPNLNTVLYDNCVSHGHIVDTLQENYINITRFDIEERVLAGQFKLYFKSDDCEIEEYVISEGRFDLPFSIY